MKLIFLLLLSMHLYGQDVRDKWIDSVRSLMDHKCFELQEVQLLFQTGYANSLPGKLKLQWKETNLINEVTKQYNTLYTYYIVNKKEELIPALQYGVKDVIHIKNISNQRRNSHALRL